MLQFDYEAVAGETVTDIVGQPDVAGGWWSIAIRLGARSIVARVDVDSDEIIVSLEESPTAADWEPVGPMREAVGSALGWCWVGRNYRGYLDMFAVSFADLEPQFVFVAVASALKLRRVSAAA